MKQELIQNIYNLLASSIRNSHSYLRRSRGFISEMKFKEKCEEDEKEYLDGGWIFFKGDSFVVDKETAYITTSFDNPEKYIKFYSLLSECPIIKKMFFFKIRPHNEWHPTSLNTGVEILTPRFDVFVFENNKFKPSTENDFLLFFPKKKEKKYWKTANKEIRLLDYLNEFPEKALQETYCTRFIVDYLMKGRDCSYGMDFDGIIKEGEQYFAVETKEKDPGPKDKTNLSEEKWFFGWDTLRMLWYLYLVKTTKIMCYSVILEIDNQTDRNLVAWKRCELLELCRAINYSNAIAGGVGMGTTKGSTTIAPYKAFKEF